MADWTDVFTGGDSGGGFTGFIKNLFGGGGGGEFPSQTPPIIPPTSTPPFNPTTGGGGGNLLTSLLLGVGTPLISRLIGGGGDKDAESAMKNLRGIGKTTIPAGKALLGRAGKGELTDPQQAMVDRQKAEQKARWAQYMSELGIPVSTAMVQGQNLVDENATRLANDLINQSFEQGIKALSLGGSSSTQLLQNAMAQKRDLSEAVSQMMKQAGMILNTPTPTGGQPGSVQSQASSAAQGFGAGDYDPYANLFTTGTEYT